MRNIRFRGKDKKTGKWVYGDLTHTKGIRAESESLTYDRVMVGGYEVDEDTVGQYSGIQDFDNCKIYELDIVEWEGELYVIVFRSGMFYASIHECNPDSYGGYPLWMLCTGNCKIKGNILDNPELLEGGE